MTLQYPDVHFALCDGDTHSIVAAIICCAIVV
jgi:hypothetical protein